MEGQDIDADVVAIVIFLVVLIGMFCFALSLRDPPRSLSSYQWSLSRSRSKGKNNHSHENLDGGNVNKNKSSSLQKSVSKKSLRNKKRTTTAKMVTDALAPEEGKRGSSVKPDRRGGLVQRQGSVQQKPKRGSVKRLGSGVGSRRGSVGSQRVRRPSVKRPSVRPPVKRPSVRPSVKRPSARVVVPTEPPEGGETE